MYGLHVEWRSHGGENWEHRKAKNRMSYISWDRNTSFLVCCFFFRFLLLLFVCLFVYLFVCLFCFVFSCYLVLYIRPFQILLGNFLATFRILSNFFVREQLQATFRKTSTFLVTIGLFWTKMLNNLPFLNKLVKKKIPLVKVLNIFLVKLIFLPFEWVSCGCGN